MKSDEPKFSLLVYCGSRFGSRPEFRQAAEAVGQWIASQGGQLVYGGGRNGLMGVVADTCLAAGGRVVGIIPRDMQEREWAHTGCTELHVVETMAERKTLMLARSDAALALPGGIGTLEELFEAYTLQTLGYTQHPVGALNVCGYFDPTLQSLHQAVAHGFLAQTVADALLVGADAAELCGRLLQSVPARR